MKNYSKKLFQLSLICFFGFNGAKWSCFSDEKFEESHLEYLRSPEYLLFHEYFRGLDEKKKIQFFSSLTGEMETILGDKELKEKDREENDIWDPDRWPTIGNHQFIFYLKEHETYTLFIDDTLVKVIGTDDHYVKNTVYLHSITQEQELELLKIFVSANELSKKISEYSIRTAVANEKNSINDGWSILQKREFKKIVAWNEQASFKGVGSLADENEVSDICISRPSFSYISNKERDRETFKRYNKAYGDWLEAIMRIVFTGIDGTDNRTDEEAKDILNRLYDRVNNLEPISQLMSNHRHPELAFDVSLENRIPDKGETPEDTARINAELLARSVRFERLLSEVLAE